MQISKILLASGAAALCIMLPSLSSAQDTDAQAKAREALEKKLGEGQSQPSVVTNLPPPVAPRSKPKPAPKAAPTAPSPATTPVPAVSAPGGRPRPPAERLPAPVMK